MDGIGKILILRRGGFDFGEGEDFVFAAGGESADGISVGVRVSLFLISNEEFVIRNRGLRGCDGRACEATFATQDGFAFAALRGEDTYERGGGGETPPLPGACWIRDGSGCTRVHPYFEGWGGRVREGFGAADAPGCIPTLRGGEAEIPMESRERMLQGASLH